MIFFDNIVRLCTIDKIFLGMNEKIAMGVSKNYENIQLSVVTLAIPPPNIIPREYNDSNGTNRKQACRKKDW